MRVFLLVAVVIALLTSVALPWFWPGDKPDRRTLRTPDELLAGHDPEKLETEIRTFCSQCHGFPEPSLFPDYRWTPEIDRAFRFHRESGKHDVPEPDSRIVLAWYKKHAEPNLVATESLEVDLATVFAPPIAGPMLKGPAAISSVLLVDGPNGKRIQTSDMVTGQMNSVAADLSGYNPFHRATNPGRLRVCDLSADCDTEFLLSDLGTAGVTDAYCGQVTWIQQTNDDPAKPILNVTTLADGLGRIADARSADFDGDGDEDVIVAEFGWDKTGSVILLENDNGVFKRSVIDKRHGAVEIQIADFDADGQTDFLAIFGQEFESVELFRNTGGLKFEVRQLYRASNPAYGLSSLSVFDNDGDGDLDIMFTSGDMYDAFEIQDHHGVYLLTNDEDEFQPTLIGNQVAVMCAKAGDVDGDGDIDVVAGSFIPQESPYYKSAGYPAIVLYERTADLAYRPRILKAGDCSHAAMDLADIDDDGDLDLITSSMHDAGGKAEPAVSVWKNRTTE